MTTKKPTDEGADALPGAPEAPKRDRKTESLHVAYLPAPEGSGHDGFADAVIFGRKIDALEYAVTQEVRWEYIEVQKGDSLHAAIHSQ